MILFVEIPSDQFCTKELRKISLLNCKLFSRNFPPLTARGLVSTGSRGAAAAPPDFENPKKLSHKNAIKLDFSEKWGQNRAFGPP